MKTQMIKLNGTETLRLEWLDDFTLIKVNFDQQEINETLNFEEIKIGKSYKIGNDVIFIQLKKRIFERTTLEIFLNGKDYNRLGHKYEGNILSLLIVYSFIASISIFNYFDFYNVTFFTAISGLIYLSLGYLFFRNRHLLIGLVTLIALISEIVVRLIVITQPIQILNIPEQVFMKILMASIILTAIIFTMKEIKNKSTLANKRYM